MRRGLYITLAVLGVMLVVGAGVTAAVAYVPPGDTAVVAVTEAGVAAAGVGLAWAGMMQARVAGEYDVGRPRRRLAAAPVAEVSFDCPACGRTYRASQAVAGRPFACRACNARFTVPPQPAAG